MNQQIAPMASRVDFFLLFSGPMDLEIIGFYGAQFIFVNQDSRLKPSFFRALLS